jgi:hypothetical protein
LSTGRARASSVSYPRVGQNLLPPSEVSCGSALGDSYGVAQPRLHHPGSAKNADLAPGADATAPAHVPRAGVQGRPDRSSCGGLLENLHLVRPAVNSPPGQFKAPVQATRPAALLTTQNSLPSGMGEHRCAGSVRARRSCRRCTNADHRVRVAQTRPLGSAL